MFSDFFLMPQFQLHHPDGWGIVIKEGDDKGMVNICSYEGEVGNEKIGLPILIYDEGIRYLAHALNKMADEYGIQTIEELKNGKTN